MLHCIFVLFLLFLLHVFNVRGQFEDDQFDLNEAWFTEDMYNDTYFVKLEQKKYGIIAPGDHYIVEYYY